MAFISNLPDFRKALQACRVKERQRFGYKVKAVIKDLHIGITSKTPVWSGETLANYHWSVGHPDPEVFPRQGTGVWEATNALPLGVESQRPINQAMADYSLNQLDYTNPYKKFWLNNNCPTIGPLEDGIWPEAPFRQRSPYGMFFITLNEVFSHLESGKYNVP